MASVEDAESAKDREKRRRVLKEGEWACTDARCAGVNADHRNTCESCGKPKPRAKNKVGKEIGKEQAEKSKGLFSAEDWVCSKCGNVNWSRRKTCNTCNAPKLADLERRTGYGGGYMDRQDVEYVSRELNEEFDEFGRKKKKNYTSRSDTTLDSREMSQGEEGQLEDDGDDEEDDGDADKYKLGSDDEEEEEDADDGLDKYDFATDPELADIKIDIVKVKKLDIESDCSCSCSGGECSCEDSECEMKTKEEERQKVHKSMRERDRDRSEREERRKRSRSKDRERKRSSRSRDRERDRKRSRSRDRKRSRERDRKRSRSRSRDRKREKDRRGKEREGGRHSDRKRSRSRSRDRRR